MLLLQSMTSSIVLGIPLANRSGPKSIILSPLVSSEPLISNLDSGSMILALIYATVKSACCPLPSLKPIECCCLVCCLYIEQVDKLLNGL